MITPLTFLTFEAELELLSDLHIGDGREEKLGAKNAGVSGQGNGAAHVEEQEIAQTTSGEKSNLDNDDGHEEKLAENGETSRMATVVRDVDDKPVIPGSALKGALRAAVLASCGPEKSVELFGAEKNSEGAEGHASVVTIYAARIIEEGPPAPTSNLGLPESGKKYTFLATHVALDRKTGSAEDQKLYSVEMVPAGTRFKLEGIVRSGKAVCDLKTALGPLVSGISLGRGTTKGNGKLKLIESKISYKTKSLDVSKMKEKSDPETTIILESVQDSSSIKIVEFSMTCLGPFMSHDSTHKVDGQDNVLFALRRSEEIEYQKEGLYGVLRERCAWLAATDKIGDGCRDNEDRFKPFTSKDSPSDLCRTARLFGVPGWQGLVEIKSLKLLGGERLRKSDDHSNGGMPGIAIDRFSGAVLDTGPFYVDAWVGIKLEFNLVLREREDFPTEDDKRLFSALVKLIKVDGLLLGHGTNRGFGWFDENIEIEVKESP